MSFPLRVRGPPKPCPDRKLSRSGIPPVPGEPALDPKELKTSPKSKSLNISSLEKRL